MARGQCKNCGKGFKGHPNKKFCRPRCKDQFHNWNNPRGKFAHLNPTSPHYEELDLLDTDHPFSGEALGQWL